MKFALLLMTILASAALQAKTYTIDTEKSEVYWKGSKATGSFHEGHFKFKEGSVEIEKGKIQSGQFVVDMNSLTNLDLKDSPNYQKKLVGHLKSDDFFDASKYPTAEFKIKSVDHKSDAEALLKGDMTIKGRTQAIEVPIKMKVDKGIATGEAHLKLDRTLWDVRYGSGKFFKNLGDKLINDEFELKLKIVAK